MADENIHYLGNKRIPGLDELMRNMKPDDQLAIYDPVTDKTYRIPGRRIVTAELITEEMYFVFHYPADADEARPYWITDPYVMVYRQGALYRLAYPGRPYGSTDFDAELAAGHWELVSGTVITDEQITNWDEAHSWGDHALAGYLTQETDPVFTASPAAGVTASDIANWSAAYGWGNHALAGYLTALPAHALGDHSDVSVAGAVVGNALVFNGTNWVPGTAQGGEGTGITEELDPVFAASPAADVTTQQITNWDTAYGWGNHALAGYLTGFTETDPVFTASPAAGITATQITQWAAAYGWGDHAAQGYLKSFTETDPVFAASVAKNITQTNYNNWNTAFGWGDHAQMGYLTAMPAHALGAHTDVSTAGALEASVLTYNAVTGKWEPRGTNKFMVVNTDGSRHYAATLQAAVYNFATAGAVITMYADAEAAWVHLDKTLTINTNGFRLPAITDTTTPTTAGAGTNKVIRVVGGGVLGTLRFLETTTSAFIDVVLDGRTVTSTFSQVSFRAQSLNLYRTVYMQAGGLMWVSGASKVWIHDGVNATAGTGRCVAFGGLGNGVAGTGSEARTWTGEANLAGRFVANSQYGCISTDGLNSSPTGLVVLADNFYGENFYSGTTGTHNKGGVVCMTYNKGTERFSIQGHATMYALQPVFTSSNATNQTIEITGELRHNGVIPANMVLVHRTPNDDSLPFVEHSLGDHLDVEIGALSDGNVLTWSAVESKWRPGAVAGAGPAINHVQVTESYAVADGVTHVTLVQPSNPPETTATITLPAAAQNAGRRLVVTNASAKSIYQETASFSPAVKTGTAQGGESAKLLHGSTYELLCDGTSWTVVSYSGNSSVRYPLGASGVGLIHSWNWREYGHHDVSLKMLVAGTGIAIDDPLDGTITIRATGGSSASVFTRDTDGLVPAPDSLTSFRYLNEDGTWQTPPNTTYAVITNVEAVNPGHVTARTITGKALNDWATSKGFLTSLPAHKLEEHSDVMVSNAKNGDVLTWDALGTQWSNEDVRREYLGIGSSGNYIVSAIGTHNLIHTGASNATVTLGAPGAILGRTRYIFNRSTGTMTLDQELWTTPGGEERVTVIGPGEVWKAVASDTKWWGIKVSGGDSGEGFTAIEESQYGSHPAFTTQEQVNAFLLSGGTVAPEPTQRPALGAIVAQNDTTDTFTVNIQ